MQDSPAYNAFCFFSRYLQDGPTCNTIGYMWTVLHITSANKI